MHPQPNGIGYRHCLGLVFHAPDEMQRPAGAVELFREERLSDCTGGEPRHWRILVSGYDMDNMKARSFVEVEIPVFEPADPKRRKIHVDSITRVARQST